jgi:cell division protease FtsH
VSSGWMRNGFVYFLIMVAVVALFFSFFSPQAPERELELTALAQQVNNGEIEKMVITGEEVKVYYKDGREPAVTHKERTSDVVQTLVNLGVAPEKIVEASIAVEEPSDWGSWLAILSGVLPLIFVGALFYFLMRQAQGSNSQALSFGKSRARMFTGDKPTVTFDDVAGVAEAKQELSEVVEFLQEPEKFIQLGARIPKGVLLVGAPGTGKTLLAKAVSGEAGVPFFSISGSEFVEMFVGVGASRVRDLFDQAKRNSPCIVFVDEIDAVGRHRGAGLGGSHDEREQTLNQILVEMDGFDTDTNVIVVAATNRPDILDPALLRPGRFDRRVVLDRPDMVGRQAILEVHVKGKPLAPDVDLSVLAKRTPGFVGADLENMVNEAAILSARRDKTSIGQEEFEESVERVLAGPERHSRIIHDDEKQIIAHHEAGHALVMMSLQYCDPVHKVSIVARGMALGYTMPLPEDDRYLRSKAKFRDEMAGLLGGRSAEEIIFNDVTTGAANDLERATKLARSMVTQYGMSEKLGALTFGDKEELVFLGREIGEQRNYGEEVARTIDEEVKAFVDEAHQRATQILQERRAVLEAIATRLIEVESIDDMELGEIIAEYSGSSEAVAAS